MVVWVQKGCKEMVVYPHDQRADCELQLPLPSIPRGSCYISLAWDKDQYSEIGSFKVSTQWGLLFQLLFWVEVIHPMLHMEKLRLGEVK